MDTRALASAIVPIIGQPKLAAWHLTVMVACSCGRHLMGAGLCGQILAVCPECRVGYLVDSIAAEAGMPGQIQMQRVRLTDEFFGTGTKSDDEKAADNGQRTIES